MSEPKLDLRGTFVAVLDVLERSTIPYAFIGALPVLAWGRVRLTTDLDLVVQADTGWRRLTLELARRGFHPGRQTGPANEKDALPDIVAFHPAASPTVRVDVFVAKTEFERVVIDTAREAEVFGKKVRLARPEASIVYKLLASRPKDIEDIEAIFEARRAAGDLLDWTFLARWVQEWGIEDRLVPYQDRFRGQLGVGVPP